MRYYNGVNEMKKFLSSVLICTMIGAGFAGLIGLWNNQGIIIDEFVNATTTITDIQTGIIALWVFTGAILGVRKR